uniref:Nucleolar protein 4 n=1 Tax=Tetranychus urticae TaxID=32264 RepID=T1K4X4_TETUR
METPARRSSRYGTRVAAALAQQVICDLVSYDEVAAIVDEEEDDEIPSSNGENQCNRKIIPQSRQDSHTSQRNNLRCSVNVKSEHPSSPVANLSSTTITPITLSSTLTGRSSTSPEIGCIPPPSAESVESKLISASSGLVDENGITFSNSLYSAYQTWALKTYGDSAKTKTVTRKKYQRIVRILKGEESTNVENSKFRFWVKAKGFKLRGKAK